MVRPQEMRPGNPKAAEGASQLPCFQGLIEIAASALLRLFFRAQLACAARASTVHGSCLSAWQMDRAYAAFDTGALEFGRVFKDAVQAANAAQEDLRAQRAQLAEERVAFEHEKARVAQVIHLRARSTAWPAGCCWTSSL